MGKKEKEKLYWLEDEYDLSYGRKEKKKDRKKGRHKKRKENGKWYDPGYDEDKKERYKLTKEQKEELAKLYPHENRVKMADELERFCDMFEVYLIVEGITADEEEESLDAVRELIEKLRKKKICNIFDYDRAISIANGYDSEDEE